MNSYMIKQIATLVAKYGGQIIYQGGKYVIIFGATELIKLKFRSVLKDDVNHIYELLNKK